MKRIIILILTLVFLFTGCSVIKERTIEEEYDLNVKDEISLGIREGKTIKPALYFVQKGTDKLVAELRTIVVDGDESPVKTIVNQLLRGPIDETLLGVAPEGVNADFVEVSADVANVYLITPHDLEPKEKFILKLALANTLTDYLNIKYVDVFFNGLADGFEGYPYPIQKKTTGIWTEVYEDILGKHIAASSETDEETQPITKTIETPLYYLDASGEYLLPEVREVLFINDVYIEKLIEELSNGPRNSYVYEPSVSQELSLLTEPIFYKTDEKDTLELNLSVSPALSGFEKPEKELMSYAALIYTLTSFFPNLDIIIINVGGVRVSSIGSNIEASSGLKREDFKGYLAGGIKLYFRIKDSNLLMKADRMISQEKVWSADIRLAELMKGPKSSEGNDAWPCFPSGITTADILESNVYKSTLEVNLSKNFKDKCKNLSSDEEMLLIFAMVNTLTDMQGINSVQFLIEGEKSEELAGNLYFRDIFIKNPGFVQIDF